MAWSVSAWASVAVIFFRALGLDLVDERTEPAAGSVGELREQGVLDPGRQPERLDGGDHVPDVRGWRACAQP
jgi:hypothetical protein